MNKEQLKEMLAEMFRDGTINFNTEYSNAIVIEVDGECVQVINL